MTIFAWFASYLAMPKDVREYYIKNFDIAKNLISESMLVQNLKTIAPESSSGDPFMFENVTKMS